MSKARTRTDELVVVCDGHKAMILENLGDTAFPSLQVREMLEQENPPASGRSATAPGRLRQAPARRAAAPTSWHDAERGFLATLAHHLDATVSRDPAKTITVVAAPWALGLLRQSYSPALRRHILGEFGKDWMKEPIDRIERKLHQAKPRLH